MKNKKILQRSVLLVLALLFVFINVALHIKDVNAIETSGYEKTYGISYEDLFDLCPSYLDNEAIENTVIGNMETWAWDASFEAQQELDEAEFIHMLDKGVGGIIDKILGETGMTDTEYEQYRYKVAMSIMRDYYVTESAEIAIAEDMARNLSTLDKVIDFNSDVEEFAEWWSGKYDGCGTDEEIEKMIKEVLKLDGVADELGDATKVFNIVVELMIMQEYQYQSVDILLEAINRVNPDSEIAEALQEIKHDIELDPVSYMLENFAKKEIIDKIVKTLAKDIVVGLVGSKVAIAIDVAKEVLVFVYELVNPSYEEIQKVFIAGTLYDETVSCVNSYKKKFNKNSYTDRDVVLYEVAYNLRLSALKIFMKSGIPCLKNSDNKLLENRLKSFSGMIGSQLTYETYIEACMETVKADMDAGILTIDENTVRNPASEDGYDSYESISKKFAAIQNQYVPNAGIAWTGSWEGAIQCFGFARMVFYHLYGCQMSYHYDYYERYRFTDETNVDLIAQVSGSNVTIESLKSVLKQGKLGDVIQASGAAYGQHTMIFVSADDNGVTVYDCNARLNSSERDCLIHQWTISYNTLLKNYGTGNSSIANGLSLYRASNYAQIYGDGDGIFYDDSVNFVIENGVLTKYNGWQTIVSIPDTVTAIGDRAFENNASIRAVEIPETVKSIGNYAFKGCRRLAGVLIPDSVESIGSYAFEDCEALNTVVLPENEKFKVINSGTFLNCAALKEVDIPDSVTEIGGSAFQKCTSLSRIELPDSVISVGAYAFRNCTQIEEVKLSKSLESMEYGVFEGLTKLTEIEIPKSLDWCDYDWTSAYNAPDGVFKGCTNLKKVTFEKGTKQIAQALLFECEGIEEIVIPDTVTEIEYGAFVNCINLKKVTISDSVTTIGGSAFYGCSALSKLELPDNITSIGAYAFKNCTQIEEVKLSKNLESMGYGVFEGLTKLTEIEIPKSLDWCDYDWTSAYNAPDGVFKGCTNLKKVTFEKGTKQIAQALLFECEGIEEIVIPDTVIEIEYGAFVNCINLKKVTISDSVTTIGGSAFYGCTSLKEVDIPYSVTEIGRSAFERCTLLSRIELPDSVTFIDHYAFKDCTQVVEVKLSKKLEEIGYGAFEGLTKLTAIEIPKSLERCYYDWTSAYDAPDGVFKGCTNLKSVTFEKGTTHIAEALLFECEGIEEIVIPNTVTEIEYGVFVNCINLKKITIPNSVITIGASAFNGCTSLKELYIPDSVTEIYNSAFNGCISLEEISIPDSVTTMWGSAFSGCENLTDVKLSDNLKEISPSTFSGCTKLVNIQFPKKLETIGNCAFESCVSLKSINLPNGLNYIDWNAFAGCESLITVILPDSLAVMKSEVFMDCISLTDVHLGIGLTEIPSKAFYGCTLLQSIVIPESVREIDDNAFTNCVKLTRIAIPESVENIADNVFSYPKKLTINGYAGSYANTYADNKGIAFEAPEMINTTTDEIIVKSTPWIVRYTLTMQSVKLDENSESYQKIDLSDKVLDKNTKPEDVKFDAYDILCVDINGEPATAKDKVEIQIPCSEDNASDYNVYFVEDSGKLIDAEAVYSDGYLGFKTDKFGTYILTATKLFATDLEITATADVSAVVLGQNVKITASATGGKGTYKYTYMSYNELTGKFETLKSNSTSNTYTWYADTVGTRQFYVIVTDEKGASIESDKITVSVDKQKLSATSNASVNKVFVGESVTIYATATGGTLSYKYSYILYDKDNNKWYNLSENSESDSYTWEATSAGTMLLYVKVTDTDNTTVECNAITVTVEKPLSGLQLASDGKWYYYTNGKVDTTYTGAAKNELGVWYINKGKLDETYTGMCKYSGNWIYVNKGKYDTTYTGMSKNEYGWWYIKNGNIDTSYTGLGTNAYGTWYVKKGKLDTTYTGMYKSTTGWVYINKGKYDTGYTGMGTNAYGTWYIKNGKLDTSYTGMYKSSTGWVYINKGKYDTGYTGLGTNAYGTWYIKNGKLDTTYTGMYKSTTGWVYINKGKYDTSYTGMAKNQYGWFYMKNGKLDQTYTGMAKNQYGWWYIKNGKLDQSYTGMAKNQYGWFYMKNGKLDTSYTGMAKNQYGWWYMKNGKLDQSYTGMAKNQYGWYYMKKGKLDTTYTGLAKNAYGTWYMKNGALQKSFTGKITISGKTYQIKNGKVI